MATFRKAAKGAATAKTAIPRTAEKLEGISLPTQPNEPPENLTAYSWCLYGEKGVGKSTLAAMFSDVSAHFMFEIGRRGLKTPIIPQRGEPPLDWPRFKAYAGLLQQREPGRAIIDTLDMLARHCQLWHAQQKGLSSIMGINDHGRTWDTMKTDWENTFTALIWAGWRFTFVSHARNRPKVVRAIARDDQAQAVDSGLIATETQPTAAGWAYDWLKIPVEFAGYYGYYGRSRVLHIRGNQRMFASAGVSEDHFLQKKGAPRAGKPYDMIPMGDSPSEAYRNLQLGWDNKLEGMFSPDLEEFYQSEEA